MLKWLSLSVFAGLLALSSPAASQGPPVTPPYSVLGKNVTLSAGVVSARVTLDVNPNWQAITLYNSGTNDAYFALGTSTVTATTTPTGVGQGKVKAGTFYTIWSGGNTHLAYVTGSSTTTVEMYQGSGPIQFGLVGAPNGATPIGPAGGVLGCTYPDPCFASIADQRIMGNVSGGAAAQIALTQAQVLTFLGGTTGTGPLVRQTSPALITPTITGPAVVNNNAAPAPTAITGTALQVVGADATVGRIQVNSFGAIAAVSVTRANGTGASPTPVLSGDQIGGFNAYSYVTSAAPGYVGPVASVQSYATQNHTTTAMGSRIILATIPNGSTTLTTALTVDQDQSASIVGSLTAAALIPSGSTVPTNGMYLSGANTINLATNSNNRFQISTSAITFTLNLSGTNASGPQLSNVAASATVPTLVPNQTATTTGIGAQAAGNVSVVVGGVENARFAAALVTIVPDVSLSAGLTVANNITGGTLTGSRLTATNGSTALGDTLTTASKIYVPVYTNTTALAVGTSANWVNALIGVPTLVNTTNARTFTDAANLYISGAPVASTNVTITNAWALYVAAGNSFFGGRIFAPDGSNSLPAYSFANAATTGMFFDSGNSALSLALGGGTKIDIRSADVTLPSMRLSVGGANIASVASLSMTGVLFTGGTGTTTFPQIFVQPTGTAAVTAWSTSGTVIGANVVSGFAGNFLDFHIAGGASLFNVNSAGTITSTSSVGIVLANNGARLVLGNAGDAIIGWKGAGSIQFGNADVTTGAVAQTLNFQGNTANGTNGPLTIIRGAGGGGTTSVGGELRLSGGLSSAAAGTGGAITFYTAPAAGGNVAALALTISANTNAAFTGQISTSSTAGGIAVPATSTYFFSGSTQITNSSDGVLRLADAAGTSFGRLQLGCTANTCPSLGRNGTALTAKLADDSAFTNVQAGVFVSQPGTGLTAGGNLAVAFKATSVTDFGVYFGSGIPTIAAAKGSLYLRSDGTGVADRAYINTNGSTTWTNLVTGG